MQLSGAHTELKGKKRERAVVENQSPVKVVARTTLLWCCVCGVWGEEAAETGEKERR